MKLSIINRNSQYSLLKQVFFQSYGIFLKESMAERFEKICAESLCASVLIDKEKIVAFCFHRDIDSLTHPYLEGVSEITLQKIKNQKLLSVEWLTVAPELLGRFTKIHPGEILVGCALTLMSHSVFDAAIGFSRMDNRTDQISMRFGSQSIGVIEKFGLPCSIVYLQNGYMKAHHISKVQSKVNDLWESRINSMVEIERKKVS